MASRVHCGVCGAPMTPSSANGRSKEYVYYRCRNKDCREAVRADMADEALVTIIRETAVDDELITDVAKRANEKLRSSLPVLERKRSILAKQLSRLTAKCKRLLDNMEDMHGGSLAAQEVKARLEERIREKERVQEEIKGLESEIEALAADEIKPQKVAALLNTLSETLGNLPPNRQKQLISSVLFDAECTKTELKAYLLYPSEHITRKLRTDPDGFVQCSDWYARQESNPEPSGP